MKCERHSALFENRIKRDKLIDAKELADCLGLSVWTIRKWRAENAIPFVKLKRSVRYKLQEVIDYLEKEVVNDQKK